LREPPFGMAELVHDGLFCSLVVTAYRCASLSPAARGVAIRNGTQERHRIRLVSEAVPAPQPRKGQVGLEE